MILKTFLEMFIVGTIPSLASIHLGFCSRTITRNMGTTPSWSTRQLLLHILRIIHQHLIGHAGGLTSPPVEVSGCSSQPKIFFHEGALRGCNWEQMKRAPACLHGDVSSRGGKRIIEWGRALVWSEEGWWTHASEPERLEMAGTQQACRWKDMAATN